MKMMKFRCNDIVGDFGNRVGDGFDLKLNPGEIHRRVDIRLDSLKLTGKNITIKFETEISSTSETKISVGIIDADGVMELIGKFYPGPDRRTITIITNRPQDKPVVLRFIFHAEIQGLFKLRNLSLIHGRKIYRLDQVGFTCEDINTKKEWIKDGDELIVKSYLGRFSIKIPFQWDISQIPPKNFEVAEQLLFGSIENKIFSENRRNAASVTSSTQKQWKSDFSNVNQALLAFSFGLGSTASSAVLPSETKKYHSRRSYNYYRNSYGKMMEVFPRSVDRNELTRIENLLVIQNDLEKIAISAGMSHGYIDRYGVGAIGVLLAPLLNVKVICFGLLLDEVFLRSGNSYLEIGEISGSQYNISSKIFSDADLDLALPVAGCSEIIASKICEKDPFRDTVRMCENVKEQGTACGACFNCFRRKGFFGASSYAAPNKKTLSLLSSRPLKRGASLVYAAKAADVVRELFPEYDGVDLDFMEKYHSQGMKYVIPRDLVLSIEDKLRVYGFLPMNSDEVNRLKSIGKIFDPGGFDERRAGIYKG